MNKKFDNVEMLGGFNMVSFSKPIKIKDTEYEVVGVSTISNPQDNTLVFIQKDYESLLENLKKSEGCTVIAEKGIEIPDDLKARHNFIMTSNPRLMFTKLYRQLAKEEERNSNLYSYQNINGAIISESAKLGENVVIEPFCFIDHDVFIGDNTIIKSGAKVRSRVSIGRNCLIKENAIIGSSGFNFERDEDGDLLGTPQLGGVIINNDVEVGAFCTVASGTIDSTILGNQVKINDHAHIAHNVQIDERTIVGASTTISGSTKIGKNVWIAPNCAIMNQITIGDGAVIGLSARIHKSVPTGVTMINEGAGTIENIVKFNKYKNEFFRKEEVNNKRKVGVGHPLFKYSFNKDR